MALLWKRTAGGLVHRPGWRQGESVDEWFERIRIWQEDVCLGELGYGLYMAVGSDLGELVRWARHNLEVNEEGEVVIEVGILGPDDLQMLLELADQGEDFVLRIQPPEWNAEEPERLVVVVRPRKERRVGVIQEAAQLDGTA